MGCRTRLFFIALSFNLIIRNVYSGSYHLGPCPDLTPMTNFYMNSILENWYVVQKTSTCKKCLTYNFTKTDKPFDYKIEQVNGDPILSLLKINYKCHRAGKLSVKHQDIQSRMVLKFHFDMVDNTSYIIITSDYKDYATVFACQKLLFSRYQSVSILSPWKTIPQSTLAELHTNVGSFGINPYNLNYVDQSDCYDDVNEINGYNETSSLLNITETSTLLIWKMLKMVVGYGPEADLEDSKKVINTV